ncbi:MAG: glycosyltransferase family 2 protein [Bacteroidaceae bacterium]|nr:glycosyltransferase family 2 protein [Bacteroidaceae bacterium]
MKLSVVIVNYNVKYYLEQCLLSVERALVGIQGEVFVVDNDSSDDSIEYLKGKFPWVYYIECKRNNGFSVANNMAIRQARGEYVMLLNPDTILGEHTLHECISFMDAHPSAGGVGVRMLKEDGSFALESRRGVPTPWTSFCKMIGLGKLYPKSPFFGRYYMQYLPLDEPVEIDIMSGACMTMRRSALDQCGLLDEDFFMYGEDIDMSYRILNAGYKNYYLPTTILHYKGESTQKSSYKYAIVFHRAMLIFFKKHFRYNFVLLGVVSTLIYFKALLTYLQQQIMKRRHLNPVSIDEMRQKKFLLVGRGFNLKQMEALMESHKFYHSVSDGTPEKFDPTADYVVFDTDAYSFEEILEWFRHQDKQRKSPLIATFISQSQTILTGSSVIRMVDDKETKN